MNITIGKVNKARTKIIRTIGFNISHTGVTELNELFKTNPNYQYILENYNIVVSHNENKESMRIYNIDEIKKYLVVGVLENSLLALKEEAEELGLVGLEKASKRGLVMAISGYKHFHNIK